MCHIVYLIINHIINDNYGNIFGSSCFAINPFPSRDMNFGIFSFSGNDLLFWVLFLKIKNEEIFERGKRDRYPVWE